MFDQRKEQVAGAIKETAQQELNKQPGVAAGRHLADGAKEYAHATSRHEGFLGDPSQAPDRSLKDLQNLLKEPSANRDQMERALEGVLRSGPDGTQKVQELLSEHYSKGSGGNLETTAKALRDAAERLGWSQADFQAVTSNIAYNASAAYIEREMGQSGRLEIDTNQLHTIKSTLSFEWSGTLKNHEQVAQAVKDAVRDQVHEMVNYADKGLYENNSAYKLSSEFRLGRDVLKPDERLHQEQQINQVIFRERQPGETVADKVSELRDLQSQMKISDGEMHKLIERQVKGYLESPGARAALAGLKPEVARELLSDLNGVKDSYYYRLEKLNTNIGDAQTILEENIERGPRRHIPPATPKAPEPKAELAPQAKPAPDAALKAKQSPQLAKPQPGTGAPVTSAVANDLAEMLPPEASAKAPDAAPASQPDSKVAELEKKLLEMEKKLAEVNKREEERLKQEQDKADAERQAAEAKAEAEKKAAEAKAEAERKREVQAGVGQMLANPDISAPDKAVVLQQVQQQLGLNDEQMQREIVLPAMKEHVLPAIKELSSEQSKALKENLGLLADELPDERLAGGRSVEKAIDTHIKDLELSRAQEDTRLNDVIDRIRKSKFDEKLDFIAGLSKPEMDRLKDLYAERFKTGDRKGNFVEYMQSATFSDNGLNNSQNKQVLDAYLAGKPAVGKAYQIHHRAEGYTSGASETKISEIFSQASPKERAAIIKAYNEIPNRESSHKDFWAMAEDELDASAVAAMKKLPIE